MEDIHSSVEYQALHDEYDGKKSDEVIDDEDDSEADETEPPEDTHEPEDTQEPVDTEVPVTKEPDNWDDGQKEPVVTEKPQEQETEPPQEEEVVDPAGDVGMQEMLLWRPKRI